MNCYVGCVNKFKLNLLTVQKINMEKYVSTRQMYFLAPFSFLRGYGTWLIIIFLEVCSHAHFDGQSLACTNMINTALSVLDI